jgi:hypothetical protein
MRRCPKCGKPMKPSIRKIRKGYKKVNIPVPNKQPVGFESHERKRWSGVRKIIHKCTNPRCGFRR